MSTVFPDGHAVIIGVGADLPNTIRDAEGLADILKHQERCAYPARQVSLLTSKRATRDRILTALDELSESVGDESSVVIYFSGHGYRVTQDGVTNYYLMPYGYNTLRLQDTAISGVEFTDRLRALKAKKLLLLLDCCHAGGVGSAKSPQGEVVPDPPSSDIAKAAIPEEARNLFAQGSGRVIIASSMEAEVSYAGDPYSAFTAALVEVLCGRGVGVKDGYVRVSDLVRYTAEMVPKRTQGKQHPVMHFEQADNFKVAYYSGGAEEPKAPPFKDVKIEPQPGAWNPAPAINWNINASMISYTDESRSTAGDSYEAGGDMMFAKGNIYKSSGNMFVGGSESTRSDPLTEIFDQMKSRVTSLPPSDRKIVALLLDEAYAQAANIRQGDATSGTRETLGKRLKSLVNESREIGEEILGRLSNNSADIPVGIREVARSLKASS